MKITYDEILQSMQNAFFEECGENAELVSDIGARFQAVASELFNLACYSDFVLRQAFVQSASGEYLDRHAEMRDTARKTGAKATGEITFYAAEVSESDIEIPAGTICSVAGSSYIQFVTTESGVIEAGEESVTLSAEALEAGSAYNAKAGTITVLVTPPGGVDRVENEFAFVGGWDAESDSALRKRLLASYSVPPTGLSRKSIAECVMKIDDVLDCNIVKHAANDMYVYVKLKYPELTEEISAAINNAILVAEVTIVEPQIELATRDEYTLTITVNTDETDANAVYSAIRNAVKDYTDGIRIGEDVSLSEIYSIATHTANVHDCVVSSDSAINGIIGSAEDTYLTPDEIVVKGYE